MGGRAGKGECCFSLSASLHLLSLPFSVKPGWWVLQCPSLRNSVCQGLDIRAGPIGGCSAQGPSLSQSTLVCSSDFFSHKTKSHFWKHRGISLIASPAHPDRRPAMVFSLLRQALCMMDGHSFPHIPMGRKWIENLPLPAMNLFIRLKAGMLGRAC